MIEKIRPLGDRVLVKRIEGESQTASGIFIPDSAKSKGQMGAVVAVGAGKKDKDGHLVPLDVKMNDIVFFGQYAGVDAGEDHLIIKEDEILGVVQK
ncbi:co-chaperone GroES [bacterium]|nr:MAG: co-chaperone GroES [bacterium]QQR62191.1 MAG: co-chaperone GroES [bacterium]QQR63251.1 MAG: co-chaperone GroES [bacterium]